MSQLEVAPWLKAGIEDELRRYPVSRTVLNSFQAVPSSGSYFDAANFPAIRKVSKDDPVPNVGLGSSAHRRTSSGDPTYRAVARTLPKDLGKLLWICRAIEDVLAAAPAEWRKVVDLFYWKRMKHYEVADEMGMHENTLRHIRKDIVSVIAYRLGLCRPKWWIRIHLSAEVKRLAWGLDRSESPSRDNDCGKSGDSLPETEL